VATWKVTGVTRSFHPTSLSLLYILMKNVTILQGKRLQSNNKIIALNNNTVLSHKIPSWQRKWFRHGQWCVLASIR